MSFIAKIGKKSKKALVVLNCLQLKKAHVSQSTIMMLGRNLYFLTLVSIVAATSSEFEVAKVDDEVHLKLTFDDNTFDDVLILQPFYINEKERLAAEQDNCKFLGNLASDREASVALTGCLNEEDIQITILSRKVPLQKMFFNLKLDGEIEDLTSVSFTKCFLIAFYF